MKYLLRFFLAVTLLFISCKKEVKVEPVLNDVDSTIVSVDSKRIVNQLGVTLVPSAKKDLEKWKEYQDLDEFIIKYYNITRRDALRSAKELSQLSTYMKDTIRIEKLKTDDVYARLNVFQSETLRLADMAEIPSITDEEVENEVEQVLALFTSLNSKINTIYKAEALQKRLEIDTEKPIEIKKGINQSRVKPRTRISSRKN
jgi:hypothetical protein